MLQSSPCDEANFIRSHIFGSFFPISHSASREPNLRFRGSKHWRKDRYVNGLLVFAGNQHCLLHFQSPCQQRLTSTSWWWGSHGSYILCEEKFLRSPDSRHGRSFTHWCLLWGGCSWQGLTRPAFPGGCQAVSCTAILLTLGEQKEGESSGGNMTSWASNYKQLFKISPIEAVVFVL